MMSYELGSTAISGLVYYTGLQFPEEYRHNFFTGDVVTCQINRNSITFKGSTPISKREPDFLTSNDPWFRPVDIKVGPDGAIYIADFYNRIIGHYEVSLDHPGRDRVSGRIWRITYKGKEPHKNLTVKDWSKASSKQLIKGLAHPQLNIRMKVADRLADVWKNEAIAPLQKLVAQKGTSPEEYVQAIWILKRLGALPDPVLTTALNHPDNTIKTHALRIVLENKKLSESFENIVIQRLKDQDPTVRRTAAEVLGHFPSSAHLGKLADTYEQADPEDTHLRYTVLVALRNSLRTQEILEEMTTKTWSKSHLLILAKAMSDVPSSKGAAFILSQLVAGHLPAEQIPEYMAYVSRYTQPALLEKSIPSLRKQLSENHINPLNIYNIILSGVAQGSGEISPTLKEWGIQLAKENLSNIDPKAENWKITSLDKSGESGAWIVTNNLATETNKPGKMIIGQQAPTSRISSKIFEIPATLPLFIFDNDIYNSDSKTGNSRNTVRIKLASQPKTVAEYRFRETQPIGNNDVIKNITLDLQNYQGQKGYLEITDSSQTSTIGVSIVSTLFSSTSPEEVIQQRIQAAQLAGKYKIKELQPALLQLAKASWMDIRLRSASAEALMNIDPDENVSELSSVFSNKMEPALLRQKLATVLGQTKREKVFQLLESELSGAARSIQVSIASVLSNSQNGISHLVHALKEEQVGADVIAENSVGEKLKQNASATQQDELTKLVAEGASEREERSSVVQKRLDGFSHATILPENGKEIFTQNCSMCHQIKGNGGMIGPQLDGIGNWGQKALTEKILDPNRSISEAFRTYHITMKNGEVMSGLYRRTEGAVMVFANSDGKEFSVVKNEMKDYKASKYTLMPDQFRHTIPEKDFYALMKYLLSVK